MRFKILFTTVLALLVALSAEAQWKATFDQAMKLYNSAAAIGKGQGTLNDEQRKERIKLYTSAADKFIEARNLGPSIAPRATVLAAQSLYIAGADQNALGLKKDAYASLKRAIETWPKLNDVSESSYTRELSTFDNGQNWAYAPLGTREDWEEAFYSNYSYSSKLAAFKVKNEEEAITYAAKVLDDARVAYASMVEAAATLAHIYSTKDKCKVPEIVMKGLEAGVNYKPAGEPKRLSFENNLRALAGHIEVPGECMESDDKAKYYEKAAILLNRLHPLSDQSSNAYQFGKKAYDYGRTSTDLLFALAEASVYENKKAKDALATDDRPDAEKWLKLIEDRESSLSSEEFDRLMNLYDLMGKTDKKNAVQDEKRKKSRWEQTHFAFSTNPYNIVRWGQIPIAFDLMLPHTSHEIRFVYNKATPHQFQNDWKELGDKLFLDPLYYSGVGLSYTLKFMNQSEKKKWFYIYNGPQVRYESRTYLPENLPLLDLADRDDPDPDTVAITGKSQIINLCYLFGSQVRAKPFFLDYYIGVGLGYKTMKNPELPPNNEVNDLRYRPAKWNKAYLPLRAGIRIGFILK
jgi:hypothetical protein